MGTNFYLLRHRNNDDPLYHIGKRSAAGPYCWDCRVTLCKRGEAYVHEEPSLGVPYLPSDSQGNRHIDMREYGRRQKADWYNACPKCGARQAEPKKMNGPVAVELGFAKPYQSEDRTGVRGASSFTWAMEPERIKGLKGVVDEYGRRYTLAEFREQVLDNCPIQFTHSIGRNFS